MNKVSKIISVALVLVLALSVMVMPSSAMVWDTGADGTVKFTFKAEKYSGVDTVGVEATDIYAVTMYITNDMPVSNIICPIYYDATKFTPVDGTDMSMLDWGYTVNHGAGLNGVAYEIPAGSDLADANKYNKADVLPANRTVNGRGAISGLGKGAFKSAITNLTDTDKSASTVWWGGLDTNKYGVIVFQYSPQANYCNLQAYGTETPLLTFLFKLNAGADPNGAEFGFIEGSTKYFDVVTEKVQTKFYYDASSTTGYPYIEATSCTYSAAAPELSISWLKNQIRFNTNKDGKYANSFDYRIVSKVDNFDEVFASVEDGTAKIKDVGFVFTTGAFDVPTAKAQVEGGAVTYSQVTRCYLSNNGNAGANYAFACLVKGIADNDTNKAATLKALGYVIYENASGETAYAYYDTTLDVGALYNANSSYIPA